MWLSRVLTVSGGLKEEGAMIYKVRCLLINLFEVVVVVDCAVEVYWDTDTQLVGDLPTAE